jgi:small subunit ribosomal protein S7
MVIKNNKLKNNDSIFFSLILKKLISLLMKDGKKIKAEKILKNVLVKISLKGYSPIRTLILALNNVKPLVEVRTLNIKGKSFNVPFPIQISRQINAALKILLQTAKGKKKIENLLVEELLNSSFGRSQSVKKTLSLHKLASQNRAFTNYRWF